MITSKAMTRVFVEPAPPAKKRVLFEQMLTPEESALIDYQCVCSALRMLFPQKVNVHVEIMEC